MQGLCNKNALAKMLIQIGGVSVVYQWKSVVYQWKSVVKFVAFPVVRKRISVEISGKIWWCYIGGIPVVYQ